MAKKNNTAEKTILNAEKITQALKEGTEKRLRSLMNEAISNVIRESEDEDLPKEDDADVEDDSYEVEDVDAEETPVEDETPEEEGDEVADGEDADDEWSDMEEYKVGDNDYDFTGVDGETALKVYNKLGDDDEIFVTKDEDGNYEFKDEETGAEYVIELDPEGDADDADADFESDDEDPEIELELGDDEDEFGGDDEFDGDDDTEIEIDLGGENDDDDDDEDALNEGNLGYTDSYQKDVFAKKPNMSEPAKGMNDWDAGVPKGSEKPWAGKGNMKPFGKKKEVDEQVVLGSEANNRKKVKSAVKRQEKTGFQNVSKDGEYKGTISEAKVLKIVEAAKAVQAENKLYKAQMEKTNEEVKRTKKALCEAAVLNVNMAKIIDLLVNETTTRAEKNSILDRFNQVKTIKEGNALYESIRKELNGGTQKTAIMERQISMAPSLSETTIYQSNPALDMMSRMDGLADYYKK